MTRTKLFTALSIILPGLLNPGMSQAQSGLQLEEVIVTAQKKEETLAEAPLTVNVMDGQQINDFSMFQADELSKLTAGIEIRNEGDSNTGVALRGVGTLSTQATASRVGIYLDDWYVGKLSNFVFKQMFDMERVQILRGPQGTLYGQPSPTGAVIMTTADPNMSEIEGLVTGAFQDPTGYNLQAAVSIPLIENVLAARISVLSDQRETGLENVTRGVDNEINSDGYRAKLLWEPTDNFSAKLGWTHVESEDSDTYRPLESISPTAAFQLEADDRVSIQDAADGVPKREDDLYTLHLDWDAGPVQFKLFLADHDYKGTTESDNDLTEIPSQTVFTSGEGVDGEQLELRAIASPTDWWDTQVGYYSASISEFTQVPVFFNSTGLVANINLEIPTSEDVTAYFMHNDFYLTPDTTLTVGLRYNEFDNASANNSQFDLLIGSTMLPGGEITDPIFVSTLPCNDGSEPPCTLGAGEKVEEWTGTIKLSHALSDDHNLFATLDRGYRPGAPNFDIQGIVPEEQFTYGGESVNSVEVGFKGNLMEGRAQYTVAAYYALYEDFQVQPSYQVWSPLTGQPADVTIVFVNVDEAEQVGIEGEFRMLVTENWSVFGSLAWSQVEFTDGVVPCNDPSQPPLSADNPFNVCDAKGKEAGGQPDWSMVLQSEYRVPVDVIDGEWFVNGLFNYRGEAEVPGDSGGRLTADDYYMLDLVTGFRNEHWTANVFVKNVFDDAEIITKRAAGTDYNDISIIPPRTTGITVSYRF